MAVRMSARYAILNVAVDPSTRRAHVEFTVRNDSAETWRAAEGFGI